VRNQLFPLVASVLLLFGAEDHQSIYKTDADEQCDNCMELTLEMVLVAVATTLPHNLMNEDPVRYADN
jgi:hypothetical protein